MNIKSRGINESSFSVVNAWCWGNALMQDTVEAEFLCLKLCNQLTIQSVVKITYYGPQLDQGNEEIIRVAVLTFISEGKVK